MDKLLISYIKKELHNGDENLVIQPQDDLLGSGLVESMGMMKIIGFIEDEFEISIPPQDMVIEHFLTVEAMVNYISSRKSG
jgi:acyl carrier protein